MKYIRALWFKPWPRTLNTHRITPYHGSQWFCPCFRGWFWPILYFLCQTSTWHLDSCPPEDTWCGVILWVLRVLGQGFNQSSSELSLVVTPYWSPKKGETAVCGYSPALFWVLSVSCWCIAKLISRGTISIAVICLQNLMCLLLIMTCFDNKEDCYFEKFR